MSHCGLLRGKDIPISRFSPSGMIDMTSSTTFAVLQCRTMRAATLAYRMVQHATSPVLPWSPDLTPGPELLQILLFLTHSRFGRRERILNLIDDFVDCQQTTLVPDCIAALSEHDTSSIDAFFMVTYRTGSQITEDS